MCCLYNSPPRLNTALQGQAIHSGSLLEYQYHSGPLQPNTITCMIIQYRPVQYVYRSVPSFAKLHFCIFNGPYFVTSQTIPRFCEWLVTSWRRCPSLPILGLEFWAACSSSSSGHSGGGGRAATAGRPPATSSERTEWPSERFQILVSLEE